MPAAAAAAAATINLVVLAGLEVVAPAESVAVRQAPRALELMDSAAAAAADREVEEE